MTLVVLSFVLAACTGETLAPDAAPDLFPPLVKADNHRELFTYLQQQGYSWTTLEHGVPLFILNNLPDDLARIEIPAERKNLFFLSLLPMVLLVNEQITQEREELIALFLKHDHQESLSDEELEQVARIAADYRIDRDPLASLWVRDRLLERVDVIPPSLVLAQAATESGYGTSRFAKQGNNLFGELTFRRGTGIPPRQRPDAPYEARRFATLQDSLRSYMKNLNTNGVYRELWRLRSKMRAQNKTLRGADLVGALTSYSERGEDYVRDVRTIIKSNRLSLLSEIRLRPPPVQTNARPFTPIGALVESTDK